MSYISYMSCEIIPGPDCGAGATFALGWHAAAARCRAAAGEAGAVAKYSCYPGWRQDTPCWRGISGFTVISIILASLLDPDSETSLSQFKPFLPRSAMALEFEYARV
jgi:hypothetical protein